MGLGVWDKNLEQTILKWGASSIISDSKLWEESPQIINLSTFLLKGPDSLTMTA